MLKTGMKSSRGPQPISIEAPGCDTPETVAHETLHALGFLHEQSRPDRDDFVTINWNNIRPGAKF